MTDARIRRITAALALGMLFGLAFYLAFGERKDSSFQRGDFPAFYAAAEIVWTGRGGDLYDFALQKEIENRHWPDLTGRYYIFPYPPYFALIISPLAALPPLTAKAVASGLLFVCVLGAFATSRAVSPFFQRHLSFSVFYLLTLVPLGGSIVGVQNTTISLLIFCLFYWSVRTRNHVLTGIASSTLLYKPQFGAPLSLFLIGRGKHAELAGLLLGALTFYLLGSLVLGWSWPLTWANAAMGFGSLNFSTNGHNMISFSGLCYWTFEHFFSRGSQALLWAYLSSATLLVYFISYVRNREDRLILIPYLILFLSPQTLFYDLGIAAFFFTRDLRPYHATDFLILGLLWFYCAIALLARDQVSFPLFTPPLLALFIIHARRLNAAASTEAPTMSHRPMQ